MVQSGNVKINVEVVRGQFAEAADRIVEGLAGLENALATVHQTNRVVTDHDFLPVDGAPDDDDDECTFRNDGIDLTYCGRPRGEHQ